MPPRSLLRPFVLAGVATVLLTFPHAASAQGLIDFLWGGSQEWGGDRQSVSFNPKYTPGQIIVSFGDRRLYHITAKGRATSYPIAVPREQSRWQGTTTVSDKRENPSWRPTPDMLKENPKLPSWVPGGHPMNPLGVRALYLGASTYRIHGTDAPWTIGQAVSKGCIRMFNKDVLDLYPRIPVGTRVTVTWERFTTQAVASSDEGYEDNPTSFALTGYKSPPSRRAIRHLPTYDDDDRVENAQTAAVRMEQVAPSAPSTIEDKPIRKPAASSSTDTGSTAKKPEAKAESKADSKPEKAAEKKADAQKSEASTSSATDKAIPVSTPAERTTASTAPADKMADDKTPSHVHKVATHPAPADASGLTDAAEAASRAAEAAARAAEAARQAAEAAKKAAADAQRANHSGDHTSEPPKESAKSAAL